MGNMIKKEKLNKKQRYALDTMLSGSNVFLTGDAGTGKTTVIQTFIQEAEEMGEKRSGICYDRNSSG